MSAVVEAGPDGDGIRLDVRMVVAPCAGIFRPAPAGDVTTEAELVVAGTVLGWVEGPGMQAEVASFCRGFLVRMLAQPGERVRAGQPLAWVHPADAVVPRAVAPDPLRLRPTLPARFLGIGGHVPDRRLTNDDLAQELDTTDSWIVERTGIHARRVAGPTETTTELAAAAARRALADADLDAGQVDLVVVATATPDSACPSTASRVAAALGVEAGGFDLNAACCGFVHALHAAIALASDGSVSTVLVIGVDRFTTLVDPADRNTAVLFGDGAGAVVVGSTTGTPGGCGILGSDLGGSPAPRVLEVPPGAPHLRMDGPELYRRATRALAASGRGALDAAGASPSDVDLWVPHQANARIISAAAERLGIDEGRVVVDVAERANTSAASVPLALASARADGRLVDGAIVLLSAVGAGLDWTSLLLRWGR